MMICPSCKNRLEEVNIEGIRLDVCKNGCGGIWFDQFELQKMDEAHEFSDENLHKILAQEAKVDSIPDEKRNCPKCKDIVMMRHFFSVKKEVEVDHCPKCNGYWLDEGELFNIRNQFKTQGEREQAAKEYFSSLFDHDLEKMKKESKESAQKAEKIANMFKLVSPRNYLKM